MSLSSDRVISYLNQRFVCGYHDITGMPYAGVSDAHAPNSMAVNTTNGAGPHNIQMFFLSADGTVLHCMLGYWNADDLVGEMALADQINSVWQNPKLSRATKNAMFTQMQLGHIKEHPPEMVERSHLQHFDQAFELSHANTSDFVINPGSFQGSAVGWGGSLSGQLKTTDVVIHERMAIRPFLPFQNFDVAVFSNYGNQRYDKNEFATQQRVARMQERDGRELEMMQSRWGDARQAEMFSRRQEQVAQQMAREKEQLDRQFDPTQEARRNIRSAPAATVQVYNWNNSGQPESATTNSAPNLLTNYANTYQRTMSQVQMKSGSLATGGGFSGPGSKASGLESPDAMWQGTRVSAARYVRTYGIPSASTQLVNSPVSTPTSYVNATYAKGVYQAPTNYQSSRAPNQIANSRQVTTAVRGTVVNAPTTNQKSLRAQPEKR